MLSAAEVRLWGDTWASSDLCSQKTCLQGANIAGLAYPGLTSIGMTERHMRDLSCAVAAEKNLFILKDLLRQLPADTRLCFVGDGPSKHELEQHFAGTNTHFTVSSPLSPGSGVCCCPAASVDLAFACARLIACASFRGTEPISAQAQASMHRCHWTSDTCISVTG